MLIAGGTVAAISDHRPAYERVGGFLIVGGLALVGGSLPLFHG